MLAKEAWDKAADCTAALEKTKDSSARTLMMKQRDEWIAIANDLEAKAATGESQGK